MARECKFKDNAQVKLTKSDRIIVVDTENPKLDKAAKEILEVMKRGLDLDYNITREEIYETDRY
jgi:hypothetical protein